MNKRLGLATQEERTVASTSTLNIAPSQSQKYAVTLTSTEAANKLLCDSAMLDEINIIPEEQATNTTLGTSINWVCYNRNDTYRSL